MNSMECTAFSSLRNRIDNCFIDQGWVTVYEKITEDRLVYSGICSPEATEEALKNVSWELRCGDVTPYVSNGVYHSLNSQDVEPVVLRRGPWGAVETYSELTEDFRCYHNLFEKAEGKEKKYYYFDNNGDEELVAMVSNSKVKIKHKFIMDYISAKGKNLFIYFDFRHYSQDPIDASLCHCKVITGQNYVYEELVKDVTLEIPPYKSFCMIMGKVMIKMIENYVHDDIWGNIEERDKYETFVIKYDKDWKEVECSCCPDKLNDCFNKSRFEADYLTPVYFKKQVLDKYYQNPVKYSVDDGMLYCKGAWNMYIDNNSSEYVVVLLGDLGKFLPYKEQQYWKTYNIIPNSPGLSRTAFNRWFNGEFCEPEELDLVLRSRYSQFCKYWKDKYGWDFFLPMASDDEYNYTTIHLLSDPNNVKEFDGQILALAKSFIDSLNEKQLGKDLILPKESKGIDKLEAFLSNKNKSNPDLIEFVRNLQSLRSQTVAHRKSRRGNEQIEDYFKFSENDYGTILREIIKKLINMLDFLKTIEL